MLQNKNNFFYVTYSKVRKKNFHSFDSIPLTESTMSRIQAVTL